MCCMSICTEGSMELFDGVSGGFENMLVVKADVMNKPIGGTMELLPLCNMDCKMCYIRMSKGEMEKHGRMLTCDEWLTVAQSAKDAGVLFLLLTGGEPLMYPEFKRLYLQLLNMGFILTINTNGTLINEEWADFFAQHPCRRLNITLYGKDDATYGELCRNQRGFTQVTRAVELLKARKVPFRFNFTATPDNIDQLPELYAYARSVEIPLFFTTNVFPPARKEGEGEDQHRLSPQRCAQAHVDGVRITNPGVLMPSYAENYLKRLKMPIYSWASGKRCRAAISGFWINWKGQLLPCGMFDEPKVSLLESSFQDAWEQIAKQFRNVPLCEDCENCKLRNVCSVCFANCYTETGSTAGKPQYLCDTTVETVRLLLQYLNEEDREEYRNLLEGTLEL